MNVAAFICSATVVFGTFVVAVSSAQASRPLVLTLTREYGRAMYQECRLDVRIFEGRGRGQLHCTLSSQPPQPVTGERTLTDAEVSSFLDLAARSELCGGGHTGTDGRHGDGVLETLLTGCADGRVGILVTSGNPTFATSPRRELLETLHRIEDELRRSARALK